MNAVSVELTKNAIAIEETKNSLIIETFDIWTDYYFLQAAQVLPEHKEASG